MSELWRSNIHSIQSIIQLNLGPQLVDVVSGSPADREYWQDRLENTRQEVFRADGQTSIISSLEKTRKGNFLGSVNAWIGMQEMLKGQERPPVILMNMVFGLGKRLSPFTQALTNRKPAFPTPMRSTLGELYLSTVDTASMSAVLWLHHLASHGFRGMVVKWGDEAVIPGKIWEAEPGSYREVDGLRFVWQTQPTEDLAREKEWVEYDAYSDQMTFQYTRQKLESLQGRLSSRGHDRLVGVNLGSLGISYRLMEVLQDVFAAHVADENKWVDWDPYTWVALTCQTEDEWKAEAALEDQLGKTGIRDLEQRIPDFYQKIWQVRRNFQTRYGRQPLIKVLDFGQPYWMDWGLHTSLRRSLEALAADSELGISTRELFHLPHARDRRGNIVLRSTFPPEADIRDSVLVDTLITSPETVIHGGVVVAGRHRKLWMPDGGCALFCAADEMRFTGPHAIAFRFTGNSASLEEGGRLTCLYFANGALEMRTNEGVVQYEGGNYSLPVAGNPISFEEATRRMALEDTRLVEKRWLEKWSSWLGQQNITG
jgi:hypothetical protein